MRENNQMCDTPTERTYLGSTAIHSLINLPFGKALKVLREAEELPSDAGGLMEREGRKYLPRAAITTIENVFQHRSGSEDDYDREQHLKQLNNALSRMQDGQKELDPILVMQVDYFWLCIDGHHRLAAYEASDVEEVPVEIFTGTVDEAISVAGAENLKAKLSLSGRDRSNVAWKLTAAQIGSKRSVVEKSGVSDGTVAKMRRVRNELVEKGFKPAELDWVQAQDANEGRLGERGGDEWQDHMIEAFENKLKRTFGKNVHKNRTFISTAIGNLYPSLIEIIIEDHVIDYRAQAEGIFAEYDQG